MIHYLRKPAIGKSMIFDFSGSSVQKPSSMSQLKEYNTARSQRFAEESPIGREFLLSQQRMRHTDFAVMMGWKLETEAARRRRFIQSVARAIHPGCKSGHVLVLVGAEGIRKSTLFKMLAWPSAGATADWA